MILSHKWKFLFLKGRKVAGTSMEIALSSICGPDDIITPITDVDERKRLDLGYLGAQNYSKDRSEEESYLNNIRKANEDELKTRAIKHPLATFYNHIFFRRFTERNGPVPSDYRIFAIDRLPYAKVISMANMRLSMDSYRAGGVMKSEAGAVQRVVDLLIQQNRLKRARNIGRYCTSDKQLVAQVLKFEDLTNEFEMMMKQLDVSPLPKLPHAKKGMESNKLDIRMVLRPAQIKAINRIFRREFAVYGYEKLVLSRNGRRS